MTNSVKLLCFFSIIDMSPLYFIFGEIFLRRRTHGYISFTLNFCTSCRFSFSSCNNGSTFSLYWKRRDQLIWMGQQCTLGLSFGSLWCVVLFHFWHRAKKESHVLCTELCFWSLCLTPSWHSTCTPSPGSSLYLSVQNAIHLIIVELLLWILN